MQDADKSFDIICLSHLKWEHTLFQRPQQLMCQFSREHKVIYVAHCSTKEFFGNLLRGRIKDYVGRYNKNLHYMTMPFLPFSRRIGFLHTMTVLLTALAATALARRLKFRNIYLWLYYPPFVKQMKMFHYKKLIYDCMDLFRGFRASASNVQELENDLLRSADVVFTGGRSLQKSKEGINPRTYCFPSGVDYDHFFKATLPETPIPEDIRNIRHPILGYFGAVDERIDFGLIDHICKTRLEWSVVFLGPLVQMERPPIKRPNFHHLGKKKYSDLPGYLKAFDVCLMPFVISELTLHISPTKTPEYLAGGKPVVSTPIPDVVSDYSDVVAIASEPDEFIKKIDECLISRQDDLHIRIREKAEAKSWGHIAEEMRKIIQSPTLHSSGDGAMKCQKG